jgi:hypothetical protein
MKTNKMLSLVLGFVCVFGLTTTSAELNTPEVASNLLSNGSFEEGDYSPIESPPYWTWDAWQPTAIFAWDDTEATTGSKSVKIDAPTPNDARWIQTVDVEPNTWYFLSGWIKTDNVGHTSDFVDAGANLSLFGTYERSAGVFGSQDWTRNSLLFNSGDDEQVTIGARLGYWSGTTTGTAWFDDLQLTPIVPMDPHPRWKILVLVYESVDFTFTDSTGSEHRFVSTLTEEEKERTVTAATRFAEIDVPALTSGNMVPELTIRFPDRVVTELEYSCSNPSVPGGNGYWLGPTIARPDLDPAFDSIFVIWKGQGMDPGTGQDYSINCYGGLTWDTGVGQTFASAEIRSVSDNQENVFKHEWGHSILFYYDAAGYAPKPVVDNHIDAFEPAYVHCPTGEEYTLLDQNGNDLPDETNDNPVPNGVYNNDRGFTHDYYSGTTATADQPTRCLGITPEAWAYGGPVSHSGNIPVVPLPFTADIDIKPGNTRNVVNPRERGGVWVAILSDTDPTSPFDPPSQVDIPTVEFGPDSANAIRFKVKDKNNDGLGDLLLRFKIPETGIACGDTEATLIGETFDGESFTGTDSIKTVGCKHAKHPKKKHHKKRCDGDCDNDKTHQGKKNNRKHHNNKHHDD